MKGHQMPSPRPRKMIRFHSTVRNDKWTALSGPLSLRLLDLRRPVHRLSFLRINMNGTASERRLNSLKIFEGLSSDSQGQKLALTVSYLPYSLDRGLSAEDTGINARGFMFRACIHDKTR